MKLLVQAAGPYDPIELTNVQTVGLYDEHDQLIALAWKLTDGALCITKAGDKDFDRLVSQMGLEKRPTVRKITMGE